jgi:formamidopyrimidine-DNA glycosylase
VREKELGSDPLDVDADSFLERFEGRKGGVRAALMNQQVLAGLGNTYSEEILFLVRLHPKTSVAHPDAPILGKLHTEVRRVLKMTIEWEANPHKLPDSFSLSHRHEGERCPRGNGESRKSKTAGRTYYCLATEGEVTRKWPEKGNGRSSRNDPSRISVRSRFSGKVL